MQKKLSLSLSLLLHSASYFFVPLFVDSCSARLSYSLALLDEIPSNSFATLSSLIPPRGRCSSLSGVDRYRWRIVTESHRLRRRSEGKSRGFKICGEYSTSARGVEAA